MIDNEWSTIHRLHAVKKIVHAHLSQEYTMFVPKSVAGIVSRITVSLKNPRRVAVDGAVLVDVAVDDVVVVLVDEVIAVQHPLSSMVQSVLQTRSPPANPREMQVLPPNS